MAQEEEGALAMKNMNRTENIMFRMSPDLKKRIDWLAHRQGISANEWLNRKIENVSKDEIVKNLKPMAKIGGSYDQR